MATVDDFTAIMGEIKEVSLTDLKEQLLEDIMELKSERVREITAVAGNPDPETGEDSYRIIVECYPDEGKQYGRKYSNFFPDSRISGLLHGLNREDYYGKDVEIGFVWRKWEQEGQPRKSRNLTSIKLKDIDVNDDMGPQQPVLEPESRPTPIASPEPPPGKGKGTPPPIDAKERRISRLSLSNHAANLVAPNGDKFDSFDQMVEAYDRLHIAMCEREGVE